MNSVHGKWSKGNIKIIKTYYLPLVTFYDEDTMPLIFSNITKLREIIISEDINIVHIHQVILI